MPYSVRVSTPADDAVIMQLVRDMHAESKYAHIPFDPIEVTVLLRMANASKDFRIFLVSENQNNTVIGFAAMHAAPYAFYKGKVVNDVGVYVAPAFRNYRALLMLIDAVENWAKSINAHSLVLGVTAPKEPERVGRVYERLGFALWGTIYRKEF